MVRLPMFFCLCLSLLGQLKKSFGCGQKAVKKKSHKKNTCKSFFCATLYTCQKQLKSNFNFLCFVQNIRRLFAHDDWQKKSGWLKPEVSFFKFKLNMNQFYRGILFFVINIIHLTIPSMWCSVVIAWSTSIKNTLVKLSVFTHFSLTVIQPK